MPGKNGKENACDFCRKKFYVPKCHTNRKFCSRTCVSGFYFKIKKIGNKFKKRILLICPVCSKNFERCPSQISLVKNNFHCCSKSCKAIAMKEQKVSWGFKKTGWTNNPYVRKQKNGVRYKEHRKVMEDHLGRKLSRKELIHHINGDTKDNRLENLQIVSHEEHMKLHKKNQIPCVSFTSP